MENRKYKASCPVCGRDLFRGSPESFLEGYCPKCGSFLQIYFENNGVKAVAAPKNEAFPMQMAMEDQTE